jgi:predicted transcriptional regulator YheO
MFGANNRDLEVLDQFFQEFVTVVKSEKNQFTFNKQSNNSNVNRLLNKWQEQIEQIDTRAKEDMRVMGEITITADKVEQGIYACRVNSNTSNPMLQTLVKTINKMIDAIARDMGQLRNTLE